MCGPDGDRVDLPLLALHLRLRGFLVEEKAVQVVQSGFGWRCLGERQTWQAAARVWCTQATGRGQGCSRHAPQPLFSPLALLSFKSWFDRDHDRIRGEKFSFYLIYLILNSKWIFLSWILS